MNVFDIIGPIMIGPPVHIQPALFGWDRSPGKFSGRMWFRRALNSRVLCSDLSGAWYG